MTGKIIHGSLYLSGHTTQEVDGNMMIGSGVAVIDGSLCSRFYGSSGINVWIMRLE